MSATSAAASRAVNFKLEFDSPTDTPLQNYALRRARTFSPSLVEYSFYPKDIFACGLGMTRLAAVRTPNLEGPGSGVR